MCRHAMLLPTMWGGVLHDDTKNGCVADYAKQASCKQYTLGAGKIFEQANFSIRLKDNLEVMVSCDSCRDQLIKMGPV